MTEDEWEQSADALDWKREADRLEKNYEHALERIARLEIQLAHKDHRWDEMRHERDELREALQKLYDYLPRGSCKSFYPDGCPVCCARYLLKGPRNG
jgi:predicted  nucleic acid-binding Zn-ribbon protein